MSEILRCPDCGSSPSLAARTERPGIFCESLDCPTHPSVRIITRTSDPEINRPLIVERWNRFAGEPHKRQSGEGAATW